MSNKFISEKEQDAQLNFLKTELAKYKQKCDYLETKVDQNQYLICDLKSNLAKIVIQEDSYIQSALKEKETLNSQIATYSSAVETLEQDGPHFDKISSYWENFVEEDKN